MASPGGSDDGAASASATAAAVCCMCGDRGLPHELFRCNRCRLRLQHRYCSDLYPRVVPGPVRSCNWCLVVREDGGGAGGSPVKALAAAGSAAGRRRRLNDRGDDDDDGGRDRQEKDDRPCAGGGCTRSAFSADPAKPIKKPKKGREKKAVVQRPVVTAAAKKPRELQVAAGGKARFKVKVRRYKLLAEVIC